MADGILKFMIGHLGLGWNVQLDLVDFKVLCSAQLRLVLIGLQDFKVCDRPPETSLNGQSQTFEPRPKWPSAIWDWWPFEILQRHGTLYHLKNTAFQPNTTYRIQGVWRDFLWDKDSTTHYEWSVFWYKTLGRLHFENTWQHAFQHGYNKLQTL